MECGVCADQILSYTYVSIYTWSRSGTQDKHIQKWNAVQFSNICMYANLTNYIYHAMPCQAKAMHATPYNASVLCPILISLHPLSPSHLDLILTPSSSARTPTECSLLCSEWTDAFPYPFPSPFFSSLLLLCFDEGVSKEIVYLYLRIPIFLTPRMR